MIEDVPYRLMVRPLTEEEGGGYLVEFPDLPGCMSDGETVEAAIQNGVDAMRGWTVAMRAGGHPIPRPVERGPREGVDDRLLRVRDLRFRDGFSLRSGGGRETGGAGGSAPARVASGARLTGPTRPRRPQESCWRRPADRPGGTR